MTAAAAVKRVCSRPRPPTVNSPRQKKKYRSDCGIYVATCSLDNDLIRLMFIVEDQPEAAQAAFFERLLKWRKGWNEGDKSGQLSPNADCATHSSTSRPGKNAGSGGSARRFEETNNQNTRAGGSKTGYAA
jgi:hypothetical protein